MDIYVGWGQPQCKSFLTDSEKVKKNLSSF